MDVSVTTWIAIGAAVLAAAALALCAYAVVQIRRIRMSQ